VLSAENSVWVVNTETGNIKFIPNTIDATRSDSVDGLVARPVGNDVLRSSWRVITVH
jgi:hypothetical protein